MIDIKLLAKDFDSVVEQLKRKKVDSAILEKLQEVYFEFKSKKQDLEQLQADQNAKSKLFGIYMKEGKDITALKQEVSENKQKVAVLNDEVREIEERMSNILIAVPNIPAEEVPTGADEDENVELEKILTPKKFSFEPKAHWELGENLNWLDFERGTKLAKSRFTVIKNQASKLERALINYMLDFNGRCGFDEVSVPFIANANSLTGTGQLPKFKDDLFKIEDEELFLIPTAEVPLTNLFSDEIIPENELPIKLTAVTPSFRKEAGSGGRDIRGIIRQHQFYKVEIVAITKQEESENMLNSMVDCVSKMLTELELPHRKVLLCSGDLGFSASKTIDIEVWLPSQNTYREISSISNTQDFQARRSKIRYKTNDKKSKNILAHTLNGSSLAVGRTLVAIMENYQTQDGNIEIPEALKKYI